MKKLFGLVAVLVLFSCGNTETVDETYGYSETNPILVGGEDKTKGQEYEENYLRNLTGPNGEMVYFEHSNICCEFDTKNGWDGKGVLDLYSVHHDGMEEPVTLYFNMYDPNPGEIKAPQGFKLKE